VFAIDLNFVGLFALFILAYYGFPRKSIQASFLLAASLAFYVFFFGRAFWILLVIAAVFYACAFFIARSAGKSKQGIFVLSIAASILIVVILRYQDPLFDFFAGSAPLSANLKNSIILPAGLSFFVFKGLSYLIDLYRNKTRSAGNPLQLALYLFYFPQITAGPIQRWLSFQEDIQKIKRPDAANFYRGSTLILLGVFKKMVVADRIAFYVNEVFAAPEQKGLHLLFAAYFYAIQIYADFSGYSDIANGLSRILGYSQVKNFASPYVTRSISEFWQKWHVTLSSWLRDYLFLPISFSISRKLKKTSYGSVKSDYLIYATATMVTMLIAGFWHGAKWTFVFWGGLFGVYLSIGQASKKLRARFRKKIFGGQRLLAKGVSLWLNFNLLSFAWIFFRSLSLPAAWQFISSIGLAFPDFARGHLLMNLLLVVILFTVDFLQKSEPKFIANCPAILKAVALALAACLIIIFSVNSANEFIYMRF